MCAHTYVQLAEIVNRNTLYNSGRFNIENFYTTYIRVVYANKHNAILHYVFLIFQRDKRKTRQKKKKEKNNFDITLRNFIRHKFTKLCTPFPPTIPPRTKIEKGTKKKKTDARKMQRKDAGCTTFARQKFLFFSYTLFFFIFVSPYFFPFISALSFTSDFTQDNRVDIESGSSFSRPLATVDYLNLI